MSTFKLIDSVLETHTKVIYEIKFIGSYTSAKTEAQKIIDILDKAIDVLFNQKKTKILVSNLVELNFMKGDVNHLNLSKLMSLHKELQELKVIHYVVVSDNLDKRWIMVIRSILRILPSKIKLLTQEEFKLLTEEFTNNVELKL